MVSGRRWSVAVQGIKPVILSGGKYALHQLGRMAQGVWKKHDQSWYGEGCPRKTSVLGGMLFSECEVVENRKNCEGREERQPQRTLGGDCAQRGKRVGT